MIAGQMVLEGIRVGIKFIKKGAGRIVRILTHVKSMATGFTFDGYCQRKLVFDGTLAFS